MRNRTPDLCGNVQVPVAVRKADLQAHFDATNCKNSRSITIDSRCHEAGELRYLGISAALSDGFYRGTAHFQTGKFGEMAACDFSTLPGMTEPTYSGARAVAEEKETDDVV